MVEDRLSKKCIVFELQGKIWEKSVKFSVFFEFWNEHKEHRVANLDLEYPNRSQPHIQNSELHLFLQD